MFGFSYSTLFSPHNCGRFNLRKRPDMCCLLLKLSLIPFGVYLFLKLYTKVSL